MIRFCVDHPVSTWMLFTALVLLGLYALPRLEIEAMPETELPSLSITTNWNGASPAAVQRSLTIPVEEAARKVHGVEKIVSRSRPGNSTVTVSFRRDVDMEFAQLDLGEQLGAVRRNLPATAGQPQIVPYVPEEFRTDDFLTISLISPLSANELRDKAETWLSSRLLAVEGVADVELQGGALPLVRVMLDYHLMDRYGLYADQVYARIQALDQILPAGTVRDGGRVLAVSVQDSVTLDTIRHAVVANVGGQPLSLERIGELQRSFDDPTYFVRINGENVIQASVAKRSGTNAVAVSRRVREALPQIREEMPFPVHFEIDSDQGQELDDKLRELIYRSLAILALLFVMLAAALKRVRLTAIVVSSILLAIVICLSLFYFLGISVNFITISGLTVCFGMLLDNSILVLDAIHRRFTERRHNDARRALIHGTREVAFPITATTLTTVVAFLSFIFLSGRLALYYVPLAVSVGIAMLASIFVAFGWIPVALRGTAEREMARPEAEARAEHDAEPQGLALLWRWSLAALVVTLLGYVALGAVQGWDHALDLWRWFAGGLLLMVAVGVFAAYVERITAFHLRWWAWPVLLVAGSLAGGWYLYKNEIDEGGFWRQQDREKLVCYVERPVGTDVILASATMQKFEDELTPIPDGITMKTTSWSNQAFMEIEFEDDMLRTEYPELFRNRLILLAEEMGGMFIWINGFGDPYMKGGRGGGMSNSLIKITGYNSKELDRICSEVMDRLSRNRRVRNQRLSGGNRFERADNDETVVLIDREALSRYHVGVQEVVGHLRRLLGIEFPWHMILEGRDQRLQLSFADADDIQYDQIAAQTLTTADGRRVRLADLVTLQQIPVVSSINREDQRYSMQVNWEFIGTPRMRQAYIEEILAGLDLPYGYTAEDVSGQQITEEEEEEMNQMLWITAAFIFMTLAALFESLTLPFLVLLSLPMALSGVMAIFWLTDTAFDSSARIGLVLLFGIVVNNAILLVNRFRLEMRDLLDRFPGLRGKLPDHARLGGWDLRALPASTRELLLTDAVCRGTRIQLRSILLTSGTTIAGMLPLLIKLTEVEGKDIWENLALSSIGGLASSTVLIVGGIPVLYALSVRAGWALSRHGAAVRRVLLHGGALALAVTAVRALGDRVAGLGPQLALPGPAWLGLHVDGLLLLSGLLWLAWMTAVGLVRPSWRWRGWREALGSLILSVPAALLLDLLLKLTAGAPTAALARTVAARQLSLGLALALITAAVLALLWRRRRGDAPRTAGA
ncbi:MAG TPA: efflux RND transporter permease subunit [Candidatus Krumholzibacteria bacterium]|nr:efflux RND transporter permease subunit [Candidatus Krumholzibacteria bacterium]HRX50821.1 efflux RND transporter permease subunit [Candidatus Krumholzibacteria bacterium]